MNKTTINIDELLESTNDLKEEEKVIVHKFEIDIILENTKEWCAN